MVVPLVLNIKDGGRSRARWPRSHAFAPFPHRPRRASLFLLIKSINDTLPRLRPRAHIVNHFLLVGAYFSEYGLPQAVHVDSNYEV